MESPPKKASHCSPKKTRRVEQSLPRRTCLSCRILHSASSHGCAASKKPISTLPMPSMPHPSPSAQASLHKSFHNGTLVGKSAVICNRTDVLGALATYPEFLLPTPQGGGQPISVRVDTIVRVASATCRHGLIFQYLGRHQSGWSTPEQVRRKLSVRELYRGTAPLALLELSFTNKPVAEMQVQHSRITKQPPPATAAGFDVPAWPRGNFQHELVWGYAPDGATWPNYIVTPTSQGWELTRLNDSGLPDILFEYDSLDPMHFFDAWRLQPW